MVLGDYSKLVNAQNVQFRPGAQGDVITLYNLRISDESVIDRRNPRGGPVDTPSFSLIEITADAVIDVDLYTYFRALRQLTTRGALPTDTFAIFAENIGAGIDDFTDSGTYILRRMEDIAQEQGRYEVTLTIRVQGTMTFS